MTCKEVKYEPVGVSGKRITVSDDGTKSSYKGSPNCGGTTIPIITRGVQVLRSPNFFFLGEWKQIET